MTYCKVGDKVEVNKDVFRLTEVSQERDTTKLEEIRAAVLALSKATGVNKTRLIDALYNFRIITWGTYSFLKASEADSTGKEAISRKRILYANAGDSGVVTEILKPESTSCGEVEPWYAKVAMGSGEVKTFRLASLRLIP